VLSRTFSLLAALLMLTTSTAPADEPAQESSEDVLPANPGLDLGAGGHWGLVKESDWFDQWRTV
jgi:hypothetical protein